MTSPGVRLRAGVESDAEAVRRVHFEAVRQTAAAAYAPEVVERWAPDPTESTLEQFRRALGGDDELILVAENGDAVVGFGAIVPATGELRAVYVHPDAGRRGVGAQILRQLEQLAVERGVLALHMDASLNAEAFYARHGYQVIERGTHLVGGTTPMACVKMTKVLTTGGIGS
jgi:putative acetyltransferase